MVIGESLAVGLPVIAARTGGIPHMLEDGMSGFLVDADDLETFVDRLELLLVDRGRQAEMANQAKKKSMNFKTSTVARQTRDFYLEILGSGQAIR